MSINTENLNGDKENAEKNQLIGETRSIFEDGFVRVVDFMGSDSSVVQAARVSYGAGTKTRSDDQKLIRYMIRHKHTSPFEMCELKLHIRTPIFVARQWLRHRTANVNEYSARYSILTEKFYYPSASSFMKQSSQNKQGREEHLSEQDYQQLVSEMKQSCENAYSVYQQMLDKGVAREIARMVLPVNIYTEFYWKIDAHNLMHFLRLRCSPNAQEEIRAYASAIKDIFSHWMPITHAAFIDYQMESESYSKQELQIISKSLNREKFAAACAEENSLSDRELKKLRESLEKLRD